MESCFDRRVGIHHLLRSGGSDASLDFGDAIITVTIVAQVQLVVLRLLVVVRMQLVVLSSLVEAPIGLGLPE